MGTNLQSIMSFVKYSYNIRNVNIITLCTETQNSSRHKLIVRVPFVYNRQSSNKKRNVHDYQPPCPIPPLFLPTFPSIAKELCTHSLRTQVPCYSPALSGKIMFSVSITIAREHFLGTW